MASKNRMFSFFDHPMENDQKTNKKKYIVVDFTGLCIYRRNEYFLNPKISLGFFERFIESLAAGYLKDKPDDFITTQVESFIYFGTEEVYVFHILPWAHVIN